MSAYRALAVARELLRGPRTKQELAELLGYTERTIKRDLAAIERTGWPLRWADDSVAATSGCLPRVYWIDRGGLAPPPPAGDGEDLDVTL